MATLLLQNFTAQYLLIISLIFPTIFCIKGSSSKSPLTDNININKNLDYKYDYLNIFIIQFFVFWYVIAYLNNSKIFYLFLIISFFSIILLNKTEAKNSPFNIYNIVIPVILPTLCFLLSKSKNYIEFLIYLELIGYLFYFQFISPQKTKTLKFLDLLLYYYWVSFFGTIILFYVAYLLLFFYNTTDYNELTYIIDDNKKIINNLLFFGLLLKLGAAGVHFFKTELYKHLSLLNILSFTIWGVLVYIYIMNFFHIKGFFYIRTFDILPVFFFGLIFLIKNFKLINNFSLFLGYSAVITTTTVLFVLL